MIENTGPENYVFRRDTWDRRIETLRRKNVIIRSACLRGTRKEFGLNVKNDPSRQSQIEIGPQIRSTFGGWDLAKFVFEGIRIHVTQILSVTIYSHTKHHTAAAGPSSSSATIHKTHKAPERRGRPVRVSPCVVATDYIEETLRRGVLQYSFQWPCLRTGTHVVREPWTSAQ